MKHIKACSEQVEPSQVSCGKAPTSSEESLVKSDTEIFDTPEWPAIRAFTVPLPAADLADICEFFGSPGIFLDEFLEIVDIFVTPNKSVGFIEI